MAFLGAATGSFRALLSTCAAFLLALAVMSPATAEPVEYPEIVLEIPPPPPEDLQTFIKSAISATYVGDRPGISALDKLEEHLADDVRLYVGAVELTDGDNFDLVDIHRNWRFVREFGRFSSYDDLSLSEEDARGARELRELLEDGFVGPNPWMNGEICTSAFGRLEHAEMRALLDRTDTHDSNWRIAAFPWQDAGFMGRTGPLEWKIGQLLFDDGDAPRPQHCCWSYVQKPDGTAGYVSRSIYDPVLRHYLNSHACFGRDDEGSWKITAVGYRTP